MYVWLTKTLTARRQINQYKPFRKVGQPYVYKSHTEKQLYKEKLYLCFIGLISSSETYWPPLSVANTMWLKKAKWSADIAKWHVCAKTV